MHTVLWKATKEASTGGYKRSLGNFIRMDKGKGKAVCLL